MPIAKPSSTPSKILIVDDTYSTVAMLKQILQEFGFEVGSAYDGTTALNVVTDEQPDLILLDIMLPDMNGYQVCEQLKRNPQISDIPILFISTLDETWDKVKAFQAGGVDYITKPFQYEEVVARINAHLDLRRYRQELQQKSDTLIDTLRRLVEIVNPLTAYDNLRRLISDLYQTDGCQVLIKDANNSELHVRATSDAEMDDDLVNELIARTENDGQSLLIEDVSQDPVFRQFCDNRFLSVIFVVLKNRRGESRGALYLDRRDLGRGAFQERDLTQVKQIADMLTPVLLRLEEAEEARVDSEIQRLGLFIGDSPPMRKVYKEIEAAAKVDLTLYIQGETGTGKELVAKALHRLSRRQNRGFVDVNCAAIPQDLAESELFGHERGAFTGAVQNKAGKFKLANGGTLFLDEVAELSLELQAKLLRAIEEREIWPVGARAPERVDVRIIVATHKNLENEVSDGRFREDLFHRLNVLKINVPPLRQRQRDVLLLAHHFLSKYADEMEKNIPGFSGDALDSLRQERWPGNVRELDNTIARAIFRARDGQFVAIEDLFPDRRSTELRPVSKTAPGSSHDLSEKLQPHLDNQELDPALEAVEKFMVVETLKRNRGHKDKSSKDLKISRTRLDRLIKKFSIKIEQYS